MEITKKHVAAVINNYISTFLETNASARLIRDRLAAAGVGLRPVIDHISFRTLLVHERAREFEALGFSFDDTIGVVERDDFWYKVYRKAGFPAVLIQQAHEDARGASSPIPAWVERYTDGQLHHVAIAVDRLEHAVATLGEGGVSFVGQIVGDTDSEFRHIYAKPDAGDSMPATILELVERHWGFTGFLSISSPESGIAREMNAP